jgi:hypothetical protein
MEPERCNRVPGQDQLTDGEREVMCMRLRLMGQHTMALSWPELPVQRHVGKRQSSRAKVVDDRRSQGWNRARRVAGLYQGWDTEGEKEQVRMTVPFDCRRGHSRRKTKRWSAREKSGLGLGAQDVMDPPGVGDRHKEVAAGVVRQPTVAAGVESCEAERLPRTFPTILSWLSLSAL